MLNMDTSPPTYEEALKMCRSTHEEKKPLPKNPPPKYEEIMGKSVLIIIQKKTNQNYINLLLKKLKDDDVTPVILEEELPSYITTVMNRFSTIIMLVNDTDDLNSINNINHLYNIAFSLRKRAIPIYTCEKQSIPLALQAVKGIHVDRFEPAQML